MTLGARVSGRFKNPLCSNMAVVGKREKFAVVLAVTLTITITITIAITLGLSIRIPIAPVRRNHFLGPLARKRPEAVRRSGIPNEVEGAQLARTTASATQQPSVHDESRAETPAGKSVATLPLTPS